MRGGWHARARACVCLCVWLCVCVHVRVCECICNANFACVRMHARLDARVGMPQAHGRSSAQPHCSGLCAQEHHALRTTPLHTTPLHNPPRRFEGAEDAWRIISNGPEPLVSQFNVSYGLVLNLLSIYTLDQARNFCNKSFGAYLRVRAWGCGWGLRWQVPRLHACTQTRTHTHSRTRVRTHTHIHTRSSTCAPRMHTHVCEHTHTHTRTHTRTFSAERGQRAACRGGGRPGGAEGCAPGALPQVPRGHRASRVGEPGWALPCSM